LEKQNPPQPERRNGMNSSPFKLDIYAEAVKAAERIQPYIRETPLEKSSFLSQEYGNDIFLKLENWQITGSFKLRGALNKILSLKPEEQAAGIITASSGNHGSAVAHTLHQFGLKGTIFLPESASPAKLDALRVYNPEIHLFGDDCVKAENKARRTADEQDQVFISPYNDPLIVAGQGTAGLEIIQQGPKLDFIIVPVGGGGLISGVAGVLKHHWPNIEVIGAQPQNSPVMCASIHAGRIIDIPSQPTLSDGTAGGLETGSITFDICRELVDDFILIPEDEIAAALRWMLRRQHILVEGAAALPVAALLRQKERFSGKTGVLLITGSKLSLEQLKTILCVYHMQDTP
jgi:threonine dehydratase